MQEQYISLKDLRKVSGIGDKTIERIKEQLLQNELDKNYKSEYNANIKLDVNDIYKGDCLELMDGIPDRSIDMILCDLPYGTTRLKWDSVLPLDKLWNIYKRIIKDEGAIILFGSEPFSSMVRMSNLEMYKYDWVWKKTAGSNFLQANYQPIKRHENIMVFSKYNASYTKQNKKMNYFPILDKNGKVYSDRADQSVEVGLNAWKEGLSKDYRFKRNENEGTFPVSVIKSGSVLNNKMHPTQKPIDLCEYLIKTYTGKDGLVLDNCMGSGTTAIACINTNRNYIGIELEEDYYNIAKNRINEHKSNILLKCSIYRVNNYKCGGYYYV